MRRQRRDLGVGHGFEQDRPLRAERRIPRGADLLGAVDENAVEAEGFGEGVAGADRSTPPALGDRDQLVARVLSASMLAARQAEKPSAGTAQVPYSRVYVFQMFVP